VTQAERVLDYLWSIAPNGATNGELARSLGIRSHQTVYMLTQQLLHQGRIRGALSGTIWVFHVAEEPSTTLGTGPAWTNDTTPAARFEALARRVLSDRYVVDLTPGSLPGVAKLFDFVSPDRRVVGDAKYFSLVGGVGLPAAKFSIIAEHVWLLERPAPPPHFSYSEMTALFRCDGSPVMASWPRASHSSLCATMERSSVWPDPNDERVPVLRIRGYRPTAH
jgi:hypothetical protein